MQGDIEADTAVIGAGLAGCLTAYFLQREGVKTVVLECARIGSGQTQNTTAKITSQHGMLYDSMIKKIGMEHARLYANANQQAIEEYRNLITGEGIDCEFEEKSAYIYSTVSGGPMEREAKAAASLGLPASFMTETALPFPVKGAVRFDGQAQFHPLKFLCAISEGLNIYEQTSVQTVESDRVITDRGTVKAKHVVFTTHYPFINVPGWYFMRLHQERSYVLALENAQELDGMYIGTDADGLSFRNSGGLLLLGGGSHRTGENSKGGKYELLRQKARELWAESREVACWSAQDCITPDALPYIGQYAATTPDWYVATGFKKWGMTTSMVSALLLSDLILGRENKYAELFSPKRLNLSASAKGLATDAGQAVKGIVRQVFAIPETKLAELPCDHGGIVELDGDKVGVYKDNNGRTYVVDVRCPHLGCELEWNPDEKSWDCPCHGSRFDYSSRLIDNPAQENLTHGRESTLN